MRNNLIFHSNLISTITTAIVVLVIVLSFFSFNQEKDAVSLTKNTNIYEVTLIEPINQEKSNPPVIEEEPQVKEQVKKIEPITPPKVDDFIKKVEKKQEKKTRKEIKKVVKKENKIKKKTKEKEKKQDNKTLNTQNFDKNPRKFENTVKSNQEQIQKQSKQKKEIVFNSLVIKINDIKQYPLKAKRLKHEGVCSLSFDISKEGFVINGYVQKESSSRYINSECKRLVSKLIGFKTQSNSENFTLLVPIVFSLVD